MPISKMIEKHTLIIILYYLGFCIGPSLSQVICDNNTWIQIPSAKATQGQQNSTATNNMDCQMKCIGIVGCYGASFDQNTLTCEVNLNDVNAISFKQGGQYLYSSLIRGYSNCNSARNCTYNWYGNPNMHVSGATQNDQTNVNDCISSCQSNDQCTAIDWNTVSRSCWIYMSGPVSTSPQDSIYNFKKQCFVPRQTAVPTTTSSPGSGVSAVISRAITPLASRASSAISQLFSTPSNFTSTGSTISTSGSTTKLSSQRLETPSTVAITLSISKTTSSSSTSIPFTNTSSLSTVSPTSTTPNAACAALRCPVNKICEVRNNTAICVCNANCPSNYIPVCGSNNKTYINQCNLTSLACQNDTNITTQYNGECGKVLPMEMSAKDGKYSSYPMSIDPAYIVLAGLGAGCLLLVLTAIVILCEYPMNRAETYSTNGTLVTGNGGAYNQQINMDAEDGAENVEFNPYYNKSEIEAPDFTKEENIM